MSLGLGAEFTLPDPVFEHGCPRLRLVAVPQERLLEPVEEVVDVSARLAFRFLPGLALGFGGLKERLSPVVGLLLQIPLQLHVDALDPALDLVEHGRRSHQLGQRHGPADLPAHLGGERTGDGFESAKEPEEGFAVGYLFLLELFVRELVRQPTGLRTRGFGIDGRKRLLL